MTTRSFIPTTAQPAVNQPTAPPVVTPIDTGILPVPSGSTMSWHDLRTLVLPLPAFLTTNSHAALLDPQAISPFDDLHPHRARVRLCYRLHPRFFHEETSLDEPLVALLRASRRGRTSRRWPLRITIELTFNSGHIRRAGWSALVISSPQEAEREDCVNHVNKLLRMILRPGYIQPLTTEERTLLGRVPENRRR